MAKPAYSEPGYAKPPAQKTDLPWYIPDISKYLVPNTRRLLSEYAKVPEAEQQQHVDKIRDRLWSIRSYPCTGLGCFLTPYLPMSQAYRTILSKVKAGGIFLDIGCFCGTDMRAMVFDGAPSDKMYGIDIVSHWEPGFEMYNDRDTFKARYIEADVLNWEGQAEAEALRGKVDVVNLSAVLHQWALDTEIEACKKLVPFTKAGTIIAGYQIGATEAKDVSIGPNMPRPYRHDETSFAKMWEEVGKATSTKWATKAYARTWEYIGWDARDMGWLGEGAVVLEFVVTRQA